VQRFDVVLRISRGWLSKLYISAIFNIISAVSGGSINVSTNEHEDAFFVCFFFIVLSIFELVVKLQNAHLQEKSL